MKIHRAIFILFLGAILFGAEGCRKGPSSTHKKNNKKVKRGKPIPCPVKDC